MGLRDVIKGTSALCQGCTRKIKKNEPHKYVRTPNARKPVPVCLKCAEIFETDNPND